MLNKTQLKWHKQDHEKGHMGWCVECEENFPCTTVQVVDELLELRALRDAWKPVIKAAKAFSDDTFNSDPSSVIYLQHAVETLREWEAEQEK